MQRERKMKRGGMEKTDCQKLIMLMIQQVFAAVLND
jgi:hypothetical protein